MPALNLEGQKYWRLTALRRGPNRGKQTRWFCQCDCGNEALVSTSDMRTGNTTSCGCYHHERLRDDRLRHGGASRDIHGRTPGGRAVRDPIYRVWTTMKERCLNPNSASFYKYGARGIYVCERWRYSFEAFRDDMGPRPDGYSIERKNNNGPYSPDNCIWASQRTQMSNRRNSIRVEHQGRIISASEYAELMGVSSKRLYKVMSTRGLSPQDAARYVREHARCPA